MALLVALLPVVPTPLTTGLLTPTARCLTGADWRRYLPAGGTVLVLPLDFDSMLAGMRWQARAGVRFHLVGGYFLGPARPGGPGVLSAATTGTATWKLFGDRVDWRDPPPVTDATRAALLREVREWGVDTVVLAAPTPHADVIRATAQRVYGPARRGGDVWYWHFS